jgi:hypothetical protein
MRVALVRVIEEFHFLWENTPSPMSMSMDFSGWSFRGRLEYPNRILPGLNSTAPISFSARNQLSGLAFSNDWGEFECPKAFAYQNKS